ncbi:MAG: FAD-dependent oxidoreductase [Candidatus Promineifilaceae bacterium]|nr:FAD-dependent oxidoreductase [Candidatus Promineifilaceae bacterium]
MDPDVLIIGGGIIGVSAAYYLARAGTAVTVIDKGEIGAGSSYGNAGLICPCHSTPIAAPGVLSQGLKWLLDGASPFYIKPRLDRSLLSWIWQFRSYCNSEAFDAAVPLLRDMQRASLAQFQELIAREQLDCHFSTNGGLALYRTKEGLDYGLREAQHLQRFGLKMSELDGDAARALEPAVHPAVLGAVHLEEDAFITPYLFVQGLAQAAASRGAVLLPQTEVLSLVQQNGRINIVHTTRGRFSPHLIILSAGAWSALIARELDINLPLQPAKGYSITVQRPENAPQKYLYLGEARVAVTPMGSWLRYAGTLELAGFDFSINQRRVDAILRAAAAYLASYAEPEIVEIWRGMRPCLPDGLPMIGRAQRPSNLLVGTGHSTLGLSLGPITGQLLAELVQEKRPTLPLHPFRPERFS